MEISDSNDSRELSPDRQCSNEYKVNLKDPTVIRGVEANDFRLHNAVNMESAFTGKARRNNFACVSCHALKRKCVPSYPKDIYRYPCVGCSRTKRVCVFDLSKRTRKRKKAISNPADSYVTALSKESAPIYMTQSHAHNNPVLPGIQQSLSDLWSAISQAGTPNLDDRSKKSENSNLLNGVPNMMSSYPVPPMVAVMHLNAERRDMISPNNTTAKRRKLNRGSHLPRSIKKHLQALLPPQKDKIKNISTKMEMWSKQWNDMVQRSMFIPTISDPISIGIISQDEASYRLHIFNRDISFMARLPLVKLRENITVDELRNEKPIFFSTVMSCTSVLIPSERTTRETIMRLDSFVLNLLTNQIVKANNKSIELIESLLLLCTWYNFSEWSSRTRFHILNYVCCYLTRDLGPNYVYRSFGLFSEEQLNKFKTPLETDKNGFRLILLVYSSALNASIFVRQSVQAKWSRSMEEACDNLLKEDDSESPYSKEDNRILVLFSRLNYLLERIHTNLHETSDIIHLAADGNLIKEHQSRLFDIFCKESEDLRKEIPSDRNRLLAYHYSIEAYLYQHKIEGYICQASRCPHEIIDLPEEAFQAFERCFDCCLSCLKHFLTSSPELIASLPLFHTSRIIYALGMLLLKLRFSAVALKSFTRMAQKTEECVGYVIKVINSLDEASRLYPYNTFLYKFQYIIALFCQTYANKVISIADEDYAQHGNANNSHDQNPENSQDTPNTETLRPYDLPLGASKYNDDFNSRRAEELGQINSKPSEVNSNDIDGCSGIHASYGKNTNDNCVEAADGSRVDKTEKYDTSWLPNNDKVLDSNNNVPKFPRGTNLSPSVSSGSLDNFNEYLTDLDSLAHGVTNLNDEFWMDFFIENQ